MCEVTCYNKGCSLKFVEAQNSDTGCQHHPGAPVFHDAYKTWSCCNKKSIDFTEFLGIPGCTWGRHSNVKPVTEKKTVKPLEVGEVITQLEEVPKNRAPKQPPPERPSDDIEKIPLRTIVGASLKSALQKHNEKLEQVSASEASSSDILQVGTSCKNNTCDARYSGVQANDASPCCHHPGVPVFHEGYKFWSCCKKRTDDFDQFLKQAGCTNGTHDWLKPSELAQKQSNCRYDYRQTGTHIVVTIYAKLCDPEKCTVLANPTNLSTKLAFNGGANLFEINFQLNGVIIPEESSVEFLGVKAEIKLRKRDPISWPMLELKCVKNGVQ